MSEHHTLLTGLAGMLANIRDIRELTENDADDARYVAYWRWLDGLSTIELARERANAPLDKHRVRGAVRLNACDWQMRMRADMDRLTLGAWNGAARP